MYNTIADIEREIAELQKQKDYLALYWFEEGEADRNFNLAPQHTENFWYILGWNDRDYQIEVGFHPVPFEIF